MHFCFAFNCPVDFSSRKNHFPVMLVFPGNSSMPSIFTVPDLKMYIKWWHISHIFRLILLQPSKYNQICSTDRFSSSVGYVCFSICHIPYFSPFSILSGRVFPEIILSTERRKTRKLQIFYRGMLGEFSLTCSMHNLPWYTKHLFLAAPSIPANHGEVFNSRQNRVEGSKKNIMWKR